jgi:hypothetical protein
MGENMRDYVVASLKEATGVFSMRKAKAEFSNEKGTYRSVPNDKAFEALPIAKKWRFVAEGPGEEEARGYYRMRGTIAGDENIQELIQDMKASLDEVSEVDVGTTVIEQNQVPKLTIVITGKKVAARDKFCIAIWGEPGEDPAILEEMFAKDLKNESAAKKQAADGDVAQDGG